MIPKFRAWHKEYKVMACMLRWDSICEQVWVDVKLRRNEYDEPLEHKWNFKDIELMQWTGLQDKSGKDIYYEDIVTEDGKPYLIVESWEGVMVADYKAIIPGEDGYIVGWNHTLHPDYMDEYNIEIIGNIYENPELLEQK